MAADWGWQLPAGWQWPNGSQQGSNELGLHHLSKHGRCLVFHHSNMAHRRSQSLPLINSPHLYPPYEYQCLSSPRHIRIIRLLNYDPALSRVFISLSQHDLSSIPNHFTALSYTWGSAIETFEEEYQSSIRGPDKARLSKNPRDIELVVVPPEAYETFKGSDEASIDPRGFMVDLYTTPVSIITVAGNLSDFFRTYMAETWLRQHARSQAYNVPNLSLAEISNLWIDAVCIDQTNHQEISAQIPIMGEIYSSAGRVLAWLGADEARLSMFRWWHEIVYPKMQSMLKRDGDRAVNLFRSSSYYDAKLWRDIFSLTPPVELGVVTWLDAWGEYWAFYRARRYFQRVWVVQEVILGNRLHVHCGRGELSWDDMDGFINLLAKIKWIDAISTQLRRNIPFEYNTSPRGFGITDIFEMQRHHNGKLWRKAGWARHWFGVICAVRRRACFKPQDKVYATLGVLQQILPPEVSFPIPINTSHTPEQVFAFAATAILKNWPELSLFGFIEHPVSRTYHSLPSWVPDLTDGEFPWSLGAFDSPFKAGIVMPTEKDYTKGDWAQARSTAPIPHFRHIDPAKGTFALHGKKLDTIKSKYPCTNIYGIELAEVALQILNDLPFNYPHMLDLDHETGRMTGQRREWALVHTMTCQEITNRYRGSAEESRRLFDSFEDWLLANWAELWYAADLVDGLDAEYRAEEVDMLRKRRERVAHTLINMGWMDGTNQEEIETTASALRAARRGEGELPQVFKRPLEFRDQAMRCMWDRCLFTTENGWLGTCLNTAQEGDEIWILEGGAVPYVLKKGDEVEVEIKMGEGEARRLKTKSRRFCGEAYVHGVMDGEFLREERKHTVSWEEVVLV